MFLYCTRYGLHGFHTCSLTPSFQDCANAAETLSVRSARPTHSPYLLLCTAPSTEARLWAAIDCAGEIVRNLTFFNDIDDQGTKKCSLCPPLNMTQYGKTEPRGDFVYQNHNTVSASVFDTVRSLTQSEFVSSCICTDCSSARRCDCSSSPTAFSFSAIGALQIDSGQIITECGIQCRCPPTCGNRVVQRGSPVRLQAFKTHDGRGWGLRTLDRMKGGRRGKGKEGKRRVKEERDLDMNVCFYGLAKCAFWVNYVFLLLCWCSWCYIGCIWFYCGFLLDDVQGQIYPF